ncbi:hypothetical protein DMENIID0001_023430 [Sergentomyia squamirostris]
MFLLKVIPVVVLTILGRLCVCAEYHGEVGVGISPWTYSNIQKIQSLEERINQYRRFIIHLFTKLPGSCDLLRILEEYASSQVLDHSPDIQHLLDKLQPMSTNILSESQTPDSKKNLLDALEIYLDFTAYIPDPIAMDAIERYLRRSCLGGGETPPSGDKRGDEKVVGKKIKFHSWGGKRHQLNLDNGYRIITRTPFHSWGGKRGPPAMFATDPALYNDLY